MHIRRATPDDADQLAHVHIDSWRAAYRGLVPDSRLDAMDYAPLSSRYREALTTGTEETYVAEENAQVIGLLTLGGCGDEDVDRTTTGEIRRIYLAPEQWRKGVGRLLCQRGEQILCARGYTVVVLWVFADNRPAGQFYQTQGFEVDGASKIRNIGVPLKVIRYRKQLKMPNQSS